MADAIAHHDPIAQNVRPLLEALRDTTGETIILGKLQDWARSISRYRPASCRRYTMTAAVSARCTFLDRQGDCGRDGRRATQARVVAAQVSKLTERTIRTERST